MPNGQQTNIPISRGLEADDTIAGQKLYFYWKATRGLIILLLILEIANIIIDRYLFLHWIFEGLVFVLLSWVLMRKYKSSLGTQIAASIFLGMVAGLILAIFEIIWYHQWWYLLDLIRLPVLLSIYGLVVSVIMAIIFKNIISKRV